MRLCLPEPIAIQLELETETLREVTVADGRAMRRRCAKLEQPLPLGYCHVGVVAPSPLAGEGRGEGVKLGQAAATRPAFAPGDRVISNGKHAEMVALPVNLCARIPDTVTDEAAAFTVIGAIALQGLRLVALTLGEAVVVTGPRLIGLLTVQLLRAQGCRVLGIDLDPAKLAWRGSSAPRRWTSRPARTPSWRRRPWRCGSRIIDGSPGQVLAFWA